MNRRRALQFLVGGGAMLAFHPAWARPRSSTDDFFVFIHAGGGWDVTLWADPRNEQHGLVEPASIRNTDVSGLRHWKRAGDSFEIVTSASSDLRLGPAIGKLHEIRDRITIINGIAMNTVSHQDGMTYSTTGRHLTGGTASESSIDVVVADALGADRLMPVISISFPSAFVGNELDRRVVPLRVRGIDAITRSFARSPAYLAHADRTAIAALLSDEATALASSSTHPAVYEQLAGEQQLLPALIDGDFARSLSTQVLQAKYPQFSYRGLHGNGATAAAFAVEALHRNIARCIGFNLGGLDTHTANYRGHALTLQSLFDVIGTMVALLDRTPHPTRNGAKLADHTHILVVSEFCRTPQINPSGGRDHYPNNSALIISPRFRAGRTFGRTDPEQLLPLDAGLLPGGHAISPPDVLATFLGAFGIDARKYMRDGDVAEALLA